jgi:membrane-associated phospholipid phosphatase
MRTRTVVLLLVALGFATATYADVVTDWNTAALNAIRRGKTPPPVASRALAILHASIYDAVNGISRTHESYRVQSAVPGSASKEAAAAAAAHQVLVALFPGDAGTFDALYAATLATVPDGPHRKAGVSWGESVATAILVWRSTDNSDAMVAPPASSDPGAWQPTPPAFAPYLLPQWAFVEPFSIPTSSFGRPAGPPAVTSARYAADYNEVKALGAAVGSARTSDQDTIALFWADGAGTETPPGHWNTIAQGLAVRSGNTIDQNARLFALLNIAMADAAICAWDAKYYFHNWRPVTAIRNGDSDGNDGTVGDPAWTSFIVTPPFPDYVSGHSTFSSAAATVLAMYYGSDNVAFTTVSDFLPGVTRSFASFSAAADEAAVSRMYGGVHFRFSNEDGLSSGIAIGEWTFDHYLQSKGNRSRR